MKTSKKKKKKKHSVNILLIAHATFLPLLGSFFLFISELVKSHSQVIGVGGQQG